MVCAQPPIYCHTGTVFRRSMEGLSISACVRGGRPPPTHWSEFSVVQEGLLQYKEIGISTINGWLWRYLSVEVVVWLMYCNLTRTYRVDWTPCMQADIG